MFKTGSTTAIFVLWKIMLMFSHCCTSIKVRLKSSLNLQQIPVRGIDDSVISINLLFTMRTNLCQVIDKDREK